MPHPPAKPSAREAELLDAAYEYVLERGMVDLSLRPLATAIGSSPRVLMFLFGTKDGLIRALLARARIDELASIDRLVTEATGAPTDLVATTERIWSWLRDPAHRPVLRLWAEAYARSLVEPDGAWAGFASATVHDWLGVLALGQRPEERENDAGRARRTLALAALRGCVLDLLATDDERRVDAAITEQLRLLRGA